MLSRVHGFSLLLTRVDRTSKEMGALPVMRTAQDHGGNSNVQEGGAADAGDVGVVVAGDEASSGDVAAPLAGPAARKTNRPRRIARKAFALMDQNWSQRRRVPARAAKRKETSLSLLRR
jgi:hypothetical protein